MDKLSLPRGQMETDYQKMLRSLYITLQQQINELENGQVEQAEYFTMWVHQIKTPIAALRLLLAEEEDERSQEMWEELFSIEQYVEMALQFSRLSAKSTDFVIGEVSLDKVVREAIHKYARLFVRKKIKPVSYTHLHRYFCGVPTARYFRKSEGRTAGNKRKYPIPVSPYRMHAEIYGCRKQALVPLIHEKNSVQINSGW